MNLEITEQQEGLTRMNRILNETKEEKRAVRDGKTRVVVGSVLPRESYALDVNNSTQAS